MDIHRFEKLWIAVAIVLIVGFIATIAYGSIGAGVQMVDDSGGTVDPDNLEETEFGDPGVRKVGENHYAVYVVAQRFSFVPGTAEPIRVPAGTKITFYVTSPDVTHGFQIIGTNVNTMVIPGQVAEITVRFDEPGTYHIHCNEYCGAAHHAMEGTIVVVPQSKFTLDDGSSTTTTDGSGGEATTSGTATTTTGAGSSNATTTGPGTTTTTADVGVADAPATSVGGER